jgi:AraC-like DNA-binding protein
MGDTVLQQYYYTLYLEKMDMVHRSRLSSVAELNYIHELKKQEAKATELSLRQKLQQYVILAIFIVLLVVIVSAVLLWRQNRRLHAANKMLFERYQRMMRAEAEEQKLRKSIAYSHSSLNEEQKEMLIFRVQEVMSDAKVICQQDFTLAGLAKLVDSNTTYVSQVINEKYGMTFSILLGNHRVKEACRRISEEGERYTTLTIEAIASGVGFKSRTAFINAFKREVGLTPSEYMRMANSEK